MFSLEFSSPGRVFNDVHAILDGVIIFLYPLMLTIQLIVLYNYDIKKIDFDLIQEEVYKDGIYKEEPSEAIKKQIDEAIRHPFRKKKAEEEKKQSTNAVPQSVVQSVSGNMIDASPRSLDGDNS